MHDNQLMTWLRRCR